MESNSPKSLDYFAPLRCPKFCHPKTFAFSAFTALAPALPASPATPMPSSPAWMARPAPAKAKGSMAMLAEASEGVFSVYQ